MRKPRAHGAAAGTASVTGGSGKASAGRERLTAASRGATPTTPRCPSRPPRVRPPAGHAPRPPPLRSPRACTPQVSGRPPAARGSHLRPGASQGGCVGGRDGGATRKSPHPGEPSAESPKLAIATEGPGAGPSDGVEGYSKERGVGRVTPRSRCRDSGTKSLPWRPRPAFKTDGVLSAGERNREGAGAAPHCP